MRRRRLPLGVLVPAGMVVLVCTLAVLQFRWLGQVSEAEAEQLRVSLEHNAQEFAADFDHEVSAVYLALQSTDGAALAQGDAADLMDRLGRWRQSTRFAPLVRDVYFRSGDAPLRVLNEDEGTLEATEWPATLAPVRAQLRPEPVPQPADGQAAGIFEFRLSPMMPDVPAVIVPISSRALVTSDTETRVDLRGSVRMIQSLEIGGSLNEFHVSGDVLIVPLDADYLRETLLPTLAERHFPQQGADRYRVSIVDRSADNLVTRPAGTVISADEADIVVPFFGLRVNTVREASVAAAPHIATWAVTRTDGTEQPAARFEPLTSDRTMTVIVSEQSADEFGSPGLTQNALSAVRLSPVGWQIRVQHADGSLEAAVANARTRNLWLSFGMLALLMASVGLVVVNARRSERLAARQMNFVASVSHELRTPLAVIRSAAQNLQAGVVLEPAQARKYGDLIEDEGRRLTDMVEQVLEYAGLSGNRQPVRAAPVDVRTLTLDAIEGCRALLDEQSFEVAVNLPQDLPPVLADEDALRRAIQNLVTNALKYAADGRWLGVTAERATTAGGGTEVRLSVSDRGRGIEPDDLPHVFEPFYRGRVARDRQIHGNGLGLSLVRRIAEAHGGRLTVKSTVDQGATFTLHLPAASDNPEPAFPMGQAHSARS